MSASATSNTVNFRHRSRLREAALPTLVGIAVVAASLINFLDSERYPLFTSEIGLLLGLLLLAVLAMGLIYAAADPITRAILQALLVFLAFDFNFNGWGVLIGTIAVVALVNRQMMPFLGIASTFVLATGLAHGAWMDDRLSSFSRDEMAVSGPSLPPILHVILDEHIGVEGLVASDAPTAAIKAKIQAFYAANGFQLFGGAYSEYLHTINAIPHVLNFGDKLHEGPASKKGIAVLSNRYFDKLRSRGYNVNVYQTHFVDYCVHPAVTKCRTRPGSNLLAASTTAIAATDKALLIGVQFAKQSFAATVASAALADLQFDARVKLNQYPLPQAIAAMETFAEVTDALRVKRAGNAFFVHVLFPHYPYMMDETCGVKPMSAWSNRNDGTTAPVVAQAVLTERQRAYAEQLACLLTALQPVFDAAGPEAVVIVHGDHGSRITKVDPRSDTLGRFDWEDMIAGFSTLYAVRAPGIVAKYDKRRLPISALFNQFVMSGFRDPDIHLPSEFTPSVVLDNRAWEPAERFELPSTWR
jgi:hypothetical protein